MKTKKIIFPKELAGREIMKKARRKLSNKLSAMLALSSIALGLTTAPAISDDIDAYLVKAPEIKPSSNMLFILDESGSMRAQVPTGGTRVSNLRNAMTNILRQDSIQHFNVAIMGFTTNGRNSPELTVFGGFKRLNQRGPNGQTYGKLFEDEVNNNIGANGYTPTTIALNVGAKWFTDGWAWNGQGRRTYRDRDRVSGRNSFFSIPDPRLGTFSGASPMTADNWCAKNHIVLLSDGAPNTGIIPGRTIIPLNTSSSPSLRLRRSRQNQTMRRIYRPIMPTYNIPNRRWPAVPLAFKTLTGSARDNAELDINRLSSDSNFCRPMYQGAFSDDITKYRTRRGYSWVTWSTDARCTTDIAEFLSSNDLRPGANFPKDQNIIVNTIGFGVVPGYDEERFLKTVAEKGKGQYYHANNATDLLKAFSNIASAASTTADYAFNAPAIPIDLSDPTKVADKMFVPVLAPSTRKIWTGNVKSYRFQVSRTNSVSIYGLSNKLAFNADSTLNQDADDLWTPSQLTGLNGSKVNYGGSASRINRNSDRKIFTQSIYNNGTGLTRISASSNLLANQAGMYSASILSTDVVCDSNNLPGCIPQTDMDRYGSYLTDKSSITTTNFTLPTPAGSVQPTINGIELTLPTTSRIPRPTKIKIVADSVNKNDLPNSISVIISRTDSTTQVWSGLDLKSADIELTPDVVNGAPHAIQSIRIICDSGCSNNQKMPIAEIEVIENPATSGDLQWFLKTVLPNNLIQTVTDADNKTSTITVSKMGAPIHTKPILVDYPTQNKKIVYIPTSEGVLHAFDADTGEELWGFMPNELLGNIGLLKNNEALASDEAPEYGLDGQPYYYKLDNNGTEFKALVFGMRRGGRSYFSLDISNPSQPKLMWEINPTTPGFSKIGQTWAQPYPAPILYKGQRIRTLVLSGGYDATSDQRTEHRASASAPWNGDSYGNRIYFIDPETGQLKIVITNDASENYARSVEKVVVPKLLNGIVAQPTKVSVFLPKGYKNTYDRFYFADTGGRIIKVDIDSEKAPTASGPFVTAAVIAELGGAGKQNFIRFFTSPEVSKSYIEGKLAISIGSGNRPKILDKTTVDRIYTIIDHSTYNRVHGTFVVTEANLYDATSNDAQKINNPTAQQTSQRDAALRGIRSASGFYVKLGNLTAPYTGEKVITKVRVISGILYFVTYQVRRTAPPANSCAAAVPQSASDTRLYALNLRDATAHYKEFDGQATGQNDLPTTADRYMKIDNPAGGIPSSTTLIFGGFGSAPANGNNGNNGASSCKSGMYIASNITSKWLCIDADNSLEGISWEEVIKD